MNITSAKYQTGVSGQNSNIVAVIDDQLMSAPIDPANRHYAAILEWAEEDGNTIEEAD